MASATAWVLLACLAFRTMPTDLQAQAKVEAVYQFPSVPIREFQNGKIAGSVTNDRKVLLGSVGSALWRAANDAPSEF